MSLCCISSGSLLFAKLPVKGFPEYKGLNLKISVLNFTLFNAHFQKIAWIQNDSEAIPKGQLCKIYGCIISKNFVSRGENVFVDLYN